jgi:hypothetical protein
MSQQIEHKHLAITLFNETWKYLDSSDLTEEETFLMIHKAHASLYHWIQCGTKLNEQRGEWMVSHVYSILNMSESALLHAKRCLDITEEYEIQGFDRVFSYEAIARAYSLTKKNKAVYYLNKAYQALGQIEEKDDEEYARAQLDSIKI